MGGDNFEKLISYIRTIEVKDKAKYDILKEYENLIFAKNKILKGKDFIEYLESEHTVERKYGTISVEHVLPQNLTLNSPWKKYFSDEEHSFWKHKLANLILLSKRKNASALRKL